MCLKKRPLSWANRTALAVIFKPDFYFKIGVKTGYRRNNEQIEQAINDVNLHARIFEISLDGRLYISLLIRVGRECW